MGISRATTKASQWVTRQYGFKIGARTAISARCWLQIKFGRTRLSALLFRRFLNPPCVSSDLPVKIFDDLAEGVFLADSDDAHLAPGALHRIAGMRGIHHDG